TSPAESAANSLVNARMNKKRQMRWSPMGAHRVLQVRAAVADGRLKQAKLALAA
ncbi:ISKra4 family transposase, partial [Mesorhizobium sp. ArgA1]